MPQSSYQVSQDVLIGHKSRHTAGGMPSTQSYRELQWMPLLIRNTEFPVVLDETKAGSLGCVRALFIDPIKSHLLTIAV